MMLPFSVSAIVTVERIASSDNIDCAGEIIHYKCSIKTNSERMHLIWKVTVPGQLPLVIRYDNISDLGREDHINSFINTSLVQYGHDEYIESVLIFKVQTNVSTGNQTLLECMIIDLENESIIVLIKTSGILEVENSSASFPLVYYLEPKIPAGFNYTRVYYGVNSTTITLERHPPQDIGPEFAVDFYNISVSPQPLSNHTSIILYPRYPWNITLHYNTKYTLYLTAVNCAGESDSFILSDIEFGKGNT